MFRNLLVILAGGLLLANPLTAQGCCDKAKGESSEKVAQQDCGDKSGCSDKASDCDSGGCASGTVATTATQDEPSALAQGLAGLAAKSFSFDFALAAKEGENDVSAKGNLSFGDKTHFKLKVSAEMAQGEESQDVGLELVADGSFLYFHAQVPDTPMEYGKVNLDLVKRMAADGMKQLPMPVLDEKGALNASSIDKAIAMSGMKVVRDAEKGTITMTMAKPMAEGEEGPGESFTLTLNSKTFLPLAIVASQGKDSTVKVDFANVKVMKNMAAFGEAAFNFVVPEDVAVMDLTPMLEMQMGGEEEEELEF
jgi:outer membrane lipoprotein-sorting protein